jgi:hypothetical protein
MDCRIHFLEPYFEDEPLNSCLIIDFRFHFEIRLSSSFEPLSFLQAFIFISHWARADFLYSHLFFKYFRHWSSRRAFARFSFRLLSFFRCRFITLFSLSIFADFQMAFIFTRWDYRRYRQRRAGFSATFGWWAAFSQMPFSSLSRLPFRQPRFCRDYAELMVIFINSLDDLMIRYFHFAIYRLFSFSFFDWY